MHIGEAEVASPVPISELFMVKPERMQHGGMEIMHAGAVSLGAKAEFVSRAVHCSAFYSTTSHPDSEAIVIVVTPQFRFSTTLQFNTRSAAKFATPKNESFIKHPPLFQVC